ncbi:hypothetical protein, partial [Stenotrophomonas maltophilia]|uniref:hypothetical protein n=1 Tax=Stenotrophomonas maltophilia TaxID=40324 RepID=UPI0019549A91
PFFFFLATTTFFAFLDLAFFAFAFFAFLAIHHPPVAGDPDRRLPSRDHAVPLTIRRAPRFIVVDADAGALANFRSKLGSRCSASVL